MKYDKIVLVGLIMLAIFMISAVSATDDASVDNLTVSEDIDDSIGEASIEESDDGILSLEDNSPLEAKKDSGMELEYENYTINDITSDDPDTYWITVKFPQKVSGNLSYYIDGKYIKDKKVTANTHYFEVDLKANGLLTYGTHEIEMRYSGDSTYDSKTVKENFDVTYSLYTDYMEDETYIYGQDINLEVSFPYTENALVSYSVNGKKYSKQVSEDSDTNILISGLEIGNNNVTISFEDDKHPLKTIAFTIAVEGKIIVPYEVEYGDDAIITLTLPKDAKGNLHVFKEGDWNDTTESYDIITIQKVALKDGKASCSISNLTLGYQYINAEYDGEDYSVDGFYDSITVIPKITIPKKIWANSTDSYITFDTPGDLSAEVTIEAQYYDDYDDEYKTVASKNATIKGKQSILLPKLDAREYSIYIYYESEIFDYDNSYGLIVLNESRNETIEAEFESEQLFGNDDIQFSKISIPTSADGRLVLIVDGKIRDVEDVYDYYMLGNLTGLSVGSHNVELQYVNDTYYKSTSIKGKTSITYFKFEDEVDNVYGGYLISLPEDAKGYVTLIIDGETFTTIYANEDYSNMLDGLSLGKHNYEIRYSGDEKYAPETKTGSFELTYPVKIYAINSIDDDYEASSDIAKFDYGDAWFDIEVPMDGTGNATVYIDGKEAGTISNFTVSQRDRMRIAEYAAPDVSSGTHIIKVAYSDSKYPLKTAECEFNVTSKYNIKYPYEMIYGDDWNMNEISLILPQDAKGNLIVQIDGSKKTIKLVKGHANYSLANLTSGIYDISAYYDGSDYEVEKVHLGYGDEAIFLVSPKITTENYGSYYIANDNNTLSIEIQKGASGTFKATIIHEWTDEIHDERTINLVNGKGTLSLSNIPMGEYHIAFKYLGSDFNIPDTYCYMEMAAEEYIPDHITVGETDTATLKLPSDAKGILSVKLNDKAIAAEFSNGTITIPLSLPLEENDLSVDYKDSKYGNISFTRVIYSYHPKANITINNPSASGDKSVFDIELAGDATGKVVLSVNNKNYETALKNGKASISVPKLTSETDVIVAYTGNAKYQASSQKTTVSAPKEPKIDASGLTVMYNDGSKYSVTVYEATGQPASGTSVVFKIDGKKVSETKTNSKGVATLKITQTPKTYKISATALGKTVTKKLTVKQILTLKKVTVKKSAKKLTITATLKKVKGKYLKNKKITFKFNGKKYTAKTNSKGVAKLTIKNAKSGKNTYNFAKLKVGKKITYQATYLKDTVKKTTKVKK